MIDWKTVKEYDDITYQKAGAVARIAFNRPEVRNAFRPKTTSELYDAFYHVSEDPSVGVILLTGEGPSPKDGGHAFCSGGDQKARGEQGYVGEDGRHRLNILEVQRLIRFMPKVVIAVVNGWAVGGGHSLHVVCDLTLASEEHAIFKQTDADVTSFDGGYGSAYLAKMVGQKKAREIFFLGRNYSAKEAAEMGMVNALGRIDVDDTQVRSVAAPSVWLLGYGDWNGAASATLIGVTRYAREAVRQISDYVGEASPLSSGA